MKHDVPIRSVSRFIDILKKINADGPVTLGEMVVSTGIPYPTTSRIVQTLLTHDLIVQLPGTKTYRAAAMTMTLSAGFSGARRLAAIARPVIEAATRDIGWPLAVVTRVGADMVVRASTHHLTSLTFDVCPPGTCVPVLNSASGHAFIAFADVEEQRCFLAGMEEGESPTPMLSMFLDGRPQARIRADGYATYERNKHTRGAGKTSSIALPLHEDGRFAGALTMTFFASAMSMADALQRYLTPLRESAASIDRLSDTRHPCAVEVEAQHRDDRVEPRADPLALHLPLSILHDFPKDGFRMPGAVARSSPR